MMTKREAVARALADFEGFWHPFLYRGWDALSMTDRVYVLELADAVLEAIKAHDVPATPTVVPLKRESA